MSSNLPVPGPATISSNNAINRIASTLKNDWFALKNAYGTFSKTTAAGGSYKMAAKGAGRHLLRGMGAGAKGRLAGYAAGVAGIGALGAWGLSD